MWDEGMSEWVSRGSGGVHERASGETHSFTAKDRQSDGDTENMIVHVYQHRVHTGHEGHEGVFVREMAGSTLPSHHLTLGARY